MLGLTPRERELMTKFGFIADEVEIINCAEDFATRIHTMLFESDDALDDTFMELTSEVLSADDFASEWRLRDLGTLEEVKDLLQKLVYGHLQIMLTTLFVKGDIR